MELVKNAVSWFEIPVSNYDRARRFYEQVLSCTLEELSMGGQLMGMFPYERGKGGAGGAIIKAEGYEPNDKGSLVYLSGGKDLAVPLGRVIAAGGAIIAPKTAVGPDMGFFALIRDTEGNKVGLYSDQ